MHKAPGIIAVLFLLIMSCMVCRGQDARRWSLKPYAGLALYQFIGDEADGCRMRPGVVAGVEARYRINDFMSVSGGVEYVPRGSNLRNRDGYVRQDHICLPVLVHFHPFGPHIDLTLGAAPSFALHSVMRAGGQLLKSDDLLYRSDVLVPLGVSYCFTNGLSIGGRLTAGRKTMVRRDAFYKGEHYNLRGAKVNNNEVSVIIGYQFKL